MANNKLIEFIVKYGRPTVVPAEIPIAQYLRDFRAIEELIAQPGASLFEGKA